MSRADLNPSRRQTTMRAPILLVGVSLMARRVAAIGLLIWIAIPAHAEGTVSPDAINACTRIADPRLLQQCLDQNTGRVSRFSAGSDAGSRGDPLLEDRGVLDNDSGPPP
jgi:hypothetical protein